MYEKVIKFLVSYWAGSWGSLIVNWMIGGGSTGLRSVEEADVFSISLTKGVSGKSHLSPWVQQKPWLALAPDEQSGCMHCYASASSVRLPAVN